MTGDLADGEGGSGWGGQDASLVADGGRGLGFEPFLAGLRGLSGGLRCGFVDRSMEGGVCGQRGLSGFVRDWTTDRAEALERLEPLHRAAVCGLGFSWARFWRAEQVHGVKVACVPDEGVSGRVVPGCDALVTRVPGVLLGIYVADCAAVWAVDVGRGVIGLAHAGRRGAEGGIVANMLRVMVAELGAVPREIRVVVSPCIRPPGYEVDFAALIRPQCLEVGVRPGHYDDCGLTTSEDLRRYYSYRVEKGATGRMLALLGFAGG